MKSLKSLMLTGMMVLGLSITPLLVPVTAHASTKSQLCQGATGTNNCKPAGERTDLGVFIRNIVNILLFIVGAASVIMIVIGGLRYVTSGGDSSGVNSAKNTVLYAVIGLIVAFMAYAILNFVIVNIM